jgi:tRNA(Ile)-lysidine synthase
VEADCIATAHTEDDQAETVLLRLIRGAGSRGLAAIAPGRQRRIRPVLAVARHELQQYLRARGESWREDPTNADLGIPRNRVRHELLPYLERHFNPAMRRALARAAGSTRADEAVLARLAASCSVALVERRQEGVVLDAADLLALPEGLARRVVIHALVVAGGGVSHEEVGRVLEVAGGHCAAADLSGVRVEHFDEKVVLLHSSGGSTAAPLRESFCLELSVPGEIQTPDGWIVEARAFAHPQRRDPRPDVAQIDAAAVAGGLLVRSRRPGDRLRPAGLGGSKKLQDVLVDRKVPRHQRDAVAIVTDMQGRIVWVAGQVLGDEFRVTEGTKAVIILKLRRI